MRSLQDVNSTTQYLKKQGHGTYGERCFVQPNELRAPGMRSRPDIGPHKEVRHQDLSKQCIRRRYREALVPNQGLGRNTQLREKYFPWPHIQTLGRYMPFEEEAYAL